MHLQLSQGASSRGGKPLQHVVKRAASEINEQSRVKFIYIKKEVIKKPEPLSFRWNLVTVFHKIMPFNYFEIINKFLFMKLHIL